MQIIIVNNIIVNIMILNKRMAVAFYDVGE